MTRNRMSKLSASLIVLVMALSTLVILPSEGGLGQTVKTNVIEVPVQDNLGFFVTSATVDLTNVHTGSTIRATLTTPGLYHADNVPAGVYRIDVIAGEYYDNHTVVVDFTAYSSLVTQTVQLKSFPEKLNTWTVTLKSAATGSVIVGGTVGFYDCKLNETVASATTNSTGVATVSMFTTQVTDKFVLYAKAAGYNSTFEEMVIGGSGSRTYNLDASKRVSGYVRDWAGTVLLKNVAGYMLSMDTSLPKIVRMLESSTTGSTFEFDAFPGQFIMVIDADNGSAYVQSIPISASGSYSFDDFRLRDQTRRTEAVSIAFAPSYQGFALAVDTTWSYDEAHPGLLYSNMGSLRMQIDVTLGDGDGVLTQAEVDRFNSTLQDFGTQYVTSSGLLQVNASLYDPGAVTDFVMDLAPGSVVSETGVHYAYNCGYSKHGAIPLGGTYYDVNLTARYDGYEMDYVYTVVPVSGYELVSNQSSSLVTVSGYQVVTVDPWFVASGGQEAVALKLEKSVEPVAKAGILDSSYSYAVKDSGGNVTRYLVAVNQSVTLTAWGSDDPNKNPLTYTWNFGDGSPIEVTSNLTIAHNYTTAQSLVVNLTVTDVVGRQNWTEISVVCDDLAPTPFITVKDKDVVGNMIEANQREVIWFNATSSVDYAVSSTESPPLGVIANVQFDWGDGNKSPVIQWTADQQNTSQSYERSGTYTVTLNVTDVVGHVANKTMTVKINDTEAPKVTYIVMNATWVATQASYVENTTLHFDANTTTDNVDAITALNYSWDFADGNWWNGTGAETAWNVTHLYNKTGEFNVALNVTDSSGNFKVERKLVKVVAGPRPDLFIELVDYDPKNFTEGKSGTILVNITNRGSMNATNVQISFFIVTADGKQKEITGTGTMWLNETQVTTIEPGQKVQYRLEYTPGSKGTFIIRVNITCDDQLRPFSYTARDDQAMHVKEAAWKQLALWGGVLAIIVLIPLLFMLRGRLARREKKGPRREKKEREREKSSDEEL